MKRAGISVFIGPSVIVDPVSYIRALLYLYGKYPLADRVNSTRFYKKDITGLYRYKIQNLQNGIILNALLKLIFRDLTVKAVIDAGSFHCIYYVPYFGLSVLGLVF